MTIQELIAELDAKKEKATKSQWNYEGTHLQGDFDGDGDNCWTSIARMSVGREQDADLIVSLVNAYPKFRAAALAGERLAETVAKKVGDPGSYPVWLDEAIADYHSAAKKLIEGV